VLRRLGLEVDDTIGIQVRHRICLDASGQVTHELEQPQYMSAWARIYRLLKDAFPSGAYRFGATLARIDQDAAGVTAVFTDGSTERGELLVGADGIRSTVRELLAPAVQPAYAGYVAWRGVADEWEFPPHTHAQLFEKYTFCLPGGEMMLCYPVPGRDNDTRRGRRGYNFVWYRPTDAGRGPLPDLCTDASGHCHGMAIAPPLIRPEVITRVKAQARALLAPQVAGIVERTQPFFQAIFDLESPSLVYGRVALLGDAAFVARPHVGMGVTKAALDAESLARCIADAGGDLDVGLPRYDIERRRFGSRIVARARRLGAYLEAQHKPPAKRTAAERRQDPAVVMREIGSMAVDFDALSA
jgi:2-polyprenyl-6-methoxyphenol hydroxylase-like FAD-dependent oxidoreductase